MAIQLAEQRINEGVNRCLLPATICFKKYLSIPITSNTSCSRPPVGIGSYRLSVDLEPIVQDVVELQCCAPASNSSNVSLGPECRASPPHGTVHATTYMYPVLGFNPGVYPPLTILLYFFSCKSRRTQEGMRHARGKRQDMCNAQSRFHLASPDTDAL